jgi:hypothetical protein
VDRIYGVIRAHDAKVDALTAAFERELHAVVTSAEALALADLRERLKLDDKGRIARTASNQRALRQVDDIFADAMRRAGYEELISVFVESFNGQLPYYREIISAISETLDRPLSSALSAANEAALASQRISAVDGLHAAMESAAADAKRRALMSVGALEFNDLAQELATQFALSSTRAATLADTSIVMYYRTITDRGYKQIEEGLPIDSARYGYYGPLDKLKRTWCRKRREATLAGKTWTRSEIEAMDNGQLPNPFVTGGGYNCRDQWVLKEITQ